MGDYKQDDVATAMLKANAFEVNQVMKHVELCARIARQHVPDGPTVVRVEVTMTNEVVVTISRQMRAMTPDELEKFVREQIALVNAPPPSSDTGGC